MDLGIKDRVAIVTGAGGGIGATICEHLAREGAKVVVADIDADKAQAQAMQLEASGGSAIAVTADITDPSSVRNLVARAAEAFAQIDILVNNAGFQRDKRIVNMSEDDWDTVLDVILKGAFLQPGSIARNARAALGAHRQYLLARALGQRRPG